MKYLFTVRRIFYRLQLRHFFKIIAVLVTVINAFPQNTTQTLADKNFAKINTKSFDFAPFMQPFVRLFDAYSIDSASNIVKSNNNMYDKHSEGETSSTLKGHQSSAMIINNNNDSTASTVFNPSLFDAERLIRRIFGITTTTTTTTTTPKPSDLLVQTIFEPIIDSIEKEIHKAKTAGLRPSSMTRDGVKTLAKSPNTLFNADYDYYQSASSTQKSSQLLGEKASASRDAVDFPRRAPMPPSLRNSVLMQKMTGGRVALDSAKNNFDDAKVSLTSSKAAEPLFNLMPKVELEDPSPLASLLRFMGMDARPHADEVQVGRDQSVSVLGMPVGRRDGLALSPLTGVSLGNQDMFGPVAVNDRYNVKWDFLDKIQSVFEPQPQKKRYFYWN